MRIALAQINPTVGDLRGNCTKILHFIDRARTSGARLVVFPELSIIGYPPKDLLLKQQLIVLRRARKRAPNLTLSDRLLCGLWSIFLSLGRIRKAAIALQPSTLLAFHQALVRRKYRRLFSSTPCPKKPGPKGPDEALIQAIVELKSRNPRFGCPRIARIISQTFGIDVDKTSCIAC